MIYSSQCPICSFKGTIRSIAVIENCNIFLCPNCRTEFLFPQITLDEVKEMYDKYYKECEVDNFPLANLKKKTFLRYIQQLKLYKATGNLLDIGAYSGFLLEVAQNEGFNVFGIELSEYASQLAKNKFGANKIHTGTIQTANFEKEYFDLITICDVLEHINDPIAMLKLSSGLLKKDGYIMIVTPNDNSLVTHIVRRARQKYQFEHLYYFNTKTIERICELTGFKIIYKKSVWKTATIDYICVYLKQYKMFPLYYIFCVFQFVPFICKINFKMPSGSLMYILKKA